jgi:hypothetical protein
MNAQGPFDGRGYTEHRDAPKTNGAGCTQQDESGAADGTSKANGSKDEQQKSHYTSGSNHTWQDPDLSILDDRRGELPKFPIEILSAACQQWIVSAAHGGCHPRACCGPFVWYCLQSDWDRAPCKGVSILDAADDHLDGSCRFFRNRQDSWA